MDGRLRRLRGESSQLPLDLCVVAVATVGTVASVFLPGVNDSLVRVVLGVPFVVLYPGYALIATLFPALSDDGAGISVVERFALAVGSSVVVTGVTGALLALSPLGLRPGSSVLFIGALILTLTAAAWYRRLYLPPEQRVDWQPGDRIRSVWDSFRHPTSYAELAVNVALVLSLIAVPASATYIATGDRPAEFTEMYLLTESEGEFVADDYPTNMTRGEPSELYLGVENHEGRRTQYTSVVLLQRIESDGSVATERRLNRTTFTLDDEQRRLTHHTITPPFAGNSLRLAFLLYRGTPPANPGVENAYRETHLWVNVTDGTAS